MDIERQGDQIRVGLTGDEGDILASGRGHTRFQEFQIARRRYRKANEAAGIEGSQSPDRIWMDGDLETIGILALGFQSYITDRRGHVAPILEADPPHHPESLVAKHAQALHEIASRAIAQLRELRSESAEGKDEDELPMAWKAFDRMETFGRY